MGGKGMDWGDGGFTRGMLSSYYPRRDAIPPHPPSILALGLLLQAM